MKIEEKLGKPVDENDPRLLNLIQIIREKYSNEGRRFAFTEDEFNELLKRVGFLA